MSRLIPAVLVLFAAVLPCRAAELTIHVDGVSSDQGEIKVAIYNSEDSFLGKPLRAVAAPAHNGSVQLTVGDLPPGDYAFALFHDANNNGRIDRNAVGNPVEDYAFSNNALGKGGAPRYQDVRLSLPAGGAVATVNLR